MNSPDQIIYYIYNYKRYIIKDTVLTLNGCNQNLNISKNSIKYRKISPLLSGRTQVAYRNLTHPQFHSQMQDTRSQKYGLFWN